MHTQKPADNSKNNIKTFLITFIVTFGFIGKIRFAPGTFGSLAAIPIFILIYVKAYLQPISKLHFINSDELYHYDLMAPFFNTLFLLLGLSLILFIIGVICSGIYAKYTNSDDPKEVVIDEVAGQLFTFALSFGATADKHTFGYLLIVSIVPFLLFRFFDITKPWPIGWCDQNIKGGFGIMFDDIAAGLFASIVYWAFIRVIA